MMRRWSLLLTAVLLAQTLLAQAQPLPDEARREWRRTFLQRRPLNLPLGRHLPLAAPPAPVKGTMPKGPSFPSGNVWFPGEWEEVQAVAVTPLYRYEPLNVSNPSRWDAEPEVPGWASLYEYAPASPGSRQYAWHYRGMGPYRAVLDTADAMFEVPLRVMDAVQLAGAQAWVHVEQYADTAVLLQLLSERNLRHSNIRFFEAPANAFWYRDCGPVCFYYGETDSIGILDFQYYSGRALDDSLPTYIGRHFGLPVFPCSIEWEGGNCLVDGTGMLVTSDHVYAANADDTGQYVWNGVDISTLAVAQKAPLSSAQVRDSLRRLIATRSLRVLPAFHYDGGTGHVDLYADMRDENTFVFSKMPSRYSRWADFGIGLRNKDSLSHDTNWSGYNYQTLTIPFPARDNGGYFSSQVEYLNYTRSYSNHLLVNGLVVQPCFSPVGNDGLPTAAWDKANVERMKEAYPGYTFYCVDVRPYDGLGGALHCITKQIPATSPLRILHSPLQGQVACGTGGGVQLVAYLTNNTGIRSAQVVYRVGNGSWDSVALVPGTDSLFSASLPLCQLPNVGSARVDYFIRVSSNGGKTATKPVTASAGAYYSFSVGSQESLNVAGAEEESVGQFFPVPASTTVRLKVNVPQGTTYRVTLFDSGGRTVASTDFETGNQETFSLDVSSLPAGLYTVVFASQADIQVRKLLVR